MTAGYVNSGAFDALLSRIPKLESRALKYGYSNARIKAMKGLILKSGFLDEMVRVGSIDAMAELLQKTGYKNDLATASVEYEGSKLIEMAATRNFARTVRKLMRITPKDDRKVLQALLIRWDLMNLKTLMHAKRLKQSYEEVRPYLFDVGGLNESDFKAITKADENNLLRELRRTEIGENILSISTGQLNKRMRESMSNALKSLDMFMQMETIIDSYIYVVMESALSLASSPEISHIREILGREIDAKNILIIERMKRHGIAREKILDSLINGGTMNDQMKNKIIETKDLGATISIAKSKFLQLDNTEVFSSQRHGSKMELNSETDQTASHNMLSKLEIALEKSIAAQKALAFHRSVLSIGVVVGFLLLKEEEINNLRKIAKGKEFGISENDVKEMLVVV